MNRQEAYRAFSIVLILYYISFVGIAYINTYFVSIGLTGTQIGIISSVGALLGSIFMVWLGKVSDRLGSAKYPFLIVVIVGNGLACFLPAFRRFVGPASIVIILFGIVLAVLRTSRQSLSDAYCAAQTAPHGIPFSSIRMWGSLGYTAGSAIVVLLLLKFPIPAAFYATAVAVIPMVIYVFVADRLNRPNMPKQTEKAVPGKEKGSFKEAFRNFSFSTFMLYCIGLNAQAGITLLYMPYLIRGAGIDIKYNTLFLGFRSIIEALVMFLAGRMMKIRRLKLWHILILCGIFYSIEHLIYPHARGYLGLFLAMIPSGLGSGLQFGVGPHYIQSVVHDDVKNISQTINGMCTAAVGIIGTLAGGIIVDHFGIYALTKIDLIIIAAMTVVYIVLMLVGEKVLKKQTI